MMNLWNILDQFYYHTEVTISQVSSWPLLQLYGHCCQPHIWQNQQQYQVWVMYVANTTDMITFHSTLSKSGLSSVPSATTMFISVQAHMIVTQLATTTIILHCNFGNSKWVSSANKTVKSQFTLFCTLFHWPQADNDIWWVSDRTFSVKVWILPRVVRGRGNHFNMNEGVSVSTQSLCVTCGN